MRINVRAAALKTCVVLGRICQLRWHILPKQHEILGACDPQSPALNDDSDLAEIRAGVEGLDEGQQGAVDRGGHAEAGALADNRPIDH